MRNNSLATWRSRNPTHVEQSRVPLLKKIQKWTTKKPLLSISTFDKCKLALLPRSPKKLVIPKSSNSINNCLSTSRSAKSMGDKINNQGSHTPILSNNTLSSMKKMKLLNLLSSTIKD